MRSFVVAIAFFGLTVGMGAQSSSPIRASISQLSWLAGAWSGGGGPVTVEERWTPAAGGAMLAVSRAIKGDRMVAFDARHS